MGHTGTSEFWDVDFIRSNETFVFHPLNSYIT
jgi:hypothetical protein